MEELHAQVLIVTEEVPCRVPGKRATHFAKCLVRVGTILAHLAATSFSTATSLVTLVSTASPREEEGSSAKHNLTRARLVLDTSLSFCATR